MRIHRFRRVLLAFVLALGMGLFWPARGEYISQTANVSASAGNVVFEVTAPSVGGTYGHNNYSFSQTWLSFANVALPVSMNVSHFKITLAVTANTGAARTAIFSCMLNGNPTTLTVNQAAGSGEDFELIKSVSAAAQTVVYSDSRLENVWSFSTPTVAWITNWYWDGNDIVLTISENTGPERSETLALNKKDGFSVGTLTLTQAGVGSQPHHAPSTPTSDFGPGNASEFYISESEKAFVAGIYDLHWRNFAIRSDGYYAYANANIVDREKRSGIGAPDHGWCVAYSIIDAAIWGGWGYLGGYGYDEDLFGDAMIQSGTASDYYSSLQFVADVLWPETAPYQFNVACGSGFAQVLQGYFAAAQMMLVTQVYFDNYNWYGTTYPTISHGVACCGYSLDTTKAISDPTCLTGLFIIDSDNDRETSGGGSSAPNTITYCPVSWDASLNRYNISNVFGTTGYLSNEDDGLTYFFQCKGTYALRKSTEAAPRPVESPTAATSTPANEARGHDFGTVSEEVGKIESSAFGTPTAKRPYSAVLRDTLGKPAGILSLSVGKANSSGLCSVKASVVGLDGKKKSSNSVKASVPQSGAMHVTLFVKDYGTLEIALGANSVAGTLGRYDVLPARVGGSLGGARASFNLEDFTWTGSTELLDEYLPTEEVFAADGKRWVFDKAAVIKYKKGVFDDDAYEKGLSSGKTNNSGLKLTYNARGGTFKGNFTVYSEDSSGSATKLKKTRVTVTGVVVDGYGYGQAVIRNGGTFPVAISPVR